MVTKQEILSLRYGDYLHHVREKNADGTPARVRVNGAPKTWKRDPERWELPVKYGIAARGQFRICDSDAADWSLGYGS